MELTGARIKPLSAMRSCSARRQLIRAFGGGGRSVTEAEWLTATYVNELVYSFSSREHERKLRPFACAVARSVLPHLPITACQELITTSERYADGAISFEDMREAKLKYHEAVRHYQYEVHPSPEQDARHAVEMAGAYDRFEPNHAHQTVRYAVSSAATLQLRQVREFPNSNSDRDRITDEEEGRWVRLVRDIFGNPFRAVSFDPDWRSSTAVALAKQMYDSGDFAAMPILADALQDAGCDSEDILSHCRSANQVHVRGCWVVDLVLDKE
jgi:hypothetical protein